MSDITPDALRAKAKEWGPVIAATLCAAADSIEALTAERDAHTRVVTPSWDTKVRCACGFESVSKCEWAAHVMRELGIEGMDW